MCGAWATLPVIDAVADDVGLHVLTRSCFIVNPFGVCAAAGAVVFCFAPPRGGGRRRCVPTLSLSESPMISNNSGPDGN